jgi:outer membrane protein
MKNTFTIFLLVISFIASAQAPLSLSDAIRTALEKNYQIKISKINVEKAANLNNWGQAGMLPSVSFNLNQNNSLNQVDNPAAFIRGQYIFNSARANVDAGWTLFNGFRMWATKDRLELLEELSNGNATLVLENTIQAVILAYNTVLVEQKKMEVIQKVLNLSRDRFLYTRERQLLGVAVTFDVLQAKNAMLTDSSNVLMQQMILKNSIRNLNLIMAEEADAMFMLTDALQPVTEYYQPGPLKERMLSNNVSLRNQFINNQVLKKDVSLFQADRYPRLHLNTGVNHSENFLNVEGFPQRRGNARDYYVNFTLSFNLYNGGRARTAMLNAAIDETVGKLTLREMELTMTNQLHNLLDLYITRMQLLNLSNENLTSAETNLQFAEERFKNGTITSFEFRDVQLIYLNIALSNLSSVYDLIESHTEILRLSGGIVNQ